MKTLMLSAILSMLFVPLSSNAQLEGSYTAHGGLETFRSYGTLEYDQSMEIVGAFQLTDHQLIDLNSRNVLITNDTYNIGYDGDEVWITPNMEALGIPPRFYSSTPFYFLGLPFLFADPGANLESLGTKMLDGKEHKAVKVTFDQGIGDTPDDNYVAYVDKDTNQLKLVHYIVTYPPLMQGKSKEELERHAVVYDDWQEVGGLAVAKKMTFYEWSDDNLGDTAIGSMTVENVSFKKESPDPAIFQKPAGAVVDNSHKAK